MEIPDEATDSSILTDESILLDESASLGEFLPDETLPSNPVLVSRTHTGSVGLGASGRSSASRDGRFVVFESNANDLVSGDSNGVADVFLVDKEKLSLLRVGPASGEPNGASGRPSISADGSVVAFESNASNLVSGDDNNTTDVFLYEVFSGVLKRVSVSTDHEQGNLESFSASVSDDGNLIAFASNSNNLVPDDLNVATDIFVHNVIASTTKRVSVNSGGEAPLDNYRPSSDPVISGDGTTVVFSSYSSKLTGQNTGEYSNIYKHSLLTGVTTLVSASDTQTGNGDSGEPAISENARFVVYSSLASNLVDNDTNQLRDVFLFDSDNNLTVKISRSLNNEGSDGHSSSPSIDGAGLRIAFQSSADNIGVVGNTDAQNIFLYSLENDSLSSLDSVQPDGSSYEPNLSADGAWLVMTSDATNLGVEDLNSSSDVFLFYLD